MGEAFLFLSGGDSNSSASSVTGFRFVVVGASLLDDGIEGTSVDNKGCGSQFTRQ